MNTFNFEYKINLKIVHISPISYENVKLLYIETPLLEMHRYVFSQSKHC